MTPIDNANRAANVMALVAQYIDYIITAERVPLHKSCRTARALLVKRQRVLTTAGLLSCIACLTLLRSPRPGSPAPDKALSVFEQASGSCGYGVWVKPTIQISSDELVHRIHT